MPRDTDPELAGEARRVVRHIQHLTAEQRANRADSHRLGHRQRREVLSHFYTHPDVSGVCFDRRWQAAKAGLDARPHPETVVEPVDLGEM